MARRGGLGVGTIVVLVAVVALAWLGIRKMTDTQKELLDKADTAFAQSSGASSGQQIILPIPTQILADAGKSDVLRLDIVLRVDGLDVTADGAPSCRDGNKR